MVVELEKVESFQDFARKVEALAKNRDIEIYLKFYVSDAGYYRCYMKVNNWKYVNLWIDGNRNYDERGYADNSEDGENEIAFKGYMDTTILLSEVFDEIKYVVNTYDMLEFKKRNFKNEFVFKL
jgi:hypothetical protein